MTKTFRSFAFLASLTLGSTTLMSCSSNGYTAKQQRATQGAVGGAILGGVIGHQSGRALEGAAIGAAAGGVGGAATAR